MDVQNLTERMDKCAIRMREIVDLAETEDRNLSPEEQSEWDKLREQYVSDEDRAIRAREMEGVDESLYTAVRQYNEVSREQQPDTELAQLYHKNQRINEQVQRTYDPNKADPERINPESDFADDPEYIRAYRAYLRGEPVSRLAELRAQTSTTTGGGYTIPTGFRTDIEIAAAAFSGLRTDGGVTIWNTPSGNPIDWPTVNDTTVTGRLLAENAAETTTDITFGTVQFNAYKISSDTVLVPIELQQDQSVGLERVIARLLGERIGRIESQLFVTGTGSSQHDGVITASTEGAVTGGAAATNFDFDDFLNLEFSVDQVYANAPGARYGMHRNTLKLAMQLKDETNSNRPLWQPSVSVGVPASINGKSYFTDPNYPQHLDNSPDGGEKIVTFGDMTKFIIRDVMDMSLAVLQELYAANHQVGYVAIKRSDCDMIDAGTNPIKHLAAKA